MQKKYFLFSFIITFTLHAILLAWGSLLSFASLFSNEEALTFNNSNSSINIQIKAKKVTTVAPPIPAKKVQKKKADDKTNSYSGRPGVNQKAESITQNNPNYPYLSQVYNEEGVVKARVTISKQGKVKEVIIIESSGFKRLDDEVIRVLKQAKFKPALENGAPTRQSQEFSFTFSLK